MSAEQELALSLLIASGDGIETFTGNIYEALAPVSVRIGTSFRQAIVPVQGKVCQMPIHCYAIHAVWRKGNCIWRRGESFIQKPLFVLEELS